MRLSNLIGDLPRRIKAATAVVRASLEYGDVEEFGFTNENCEWEVRLADRVELVHRRSVVAFDHEAAILRVGRVRPDCS